ncbi:MAG: M24 family metallopeptidase [Planctomycetota bacterium]
MTIEPAEYAARLKAFRKSALADAPKGAVLIAHLPNIRYLSGFTGHDSYLLVTAEKVILLTDGRYITQAKEECPSVEVALVDMKRHVNRKVTGASGHPMNLYEQLHVHKIKQLHVDPAQLSASLYLALTEVLGKIKLKRLSGVVELQREVKSKAEIVCLRNAIQLAQSAYRTLKREIRPGLSERDISAELRYIMVRRLRAEDQSFDIIAASGPNAALPHAFPSERKLGAGEILKLDWGARLEGYHSDLTRTFFLAPVPASGELRKIHDVVLRAQEAAIAKIKPGVAWSEVDRAARSLIEAAGYGQYFIHSLGHGIGLEIHEGPRLSATSDKKAKVGNVVTVEPGIYLPGVGGVRIEDDVLVTKTGHEVLSNLSKGV